MHDDDRYLVKSISLRTSDWTTIENMSAMTGIDNTSATIRSIIREYLQLRSQNAQLKAAMWQLAKDSGVEVPELLMTS